MAGMRSSACACIARNYRSAADQDVRFWTNSAEACVRDPLTTQGARRPATRRCGHWPRATTTLVDRDGDGRGRWSGPQPSQRGRELSPVASAATGRSAPGTVGRAPATDAGNTARLCKL